MPALKISSKRRAEIIASYRAHVASEQIATQRFESYIQIQKTYDDLNPYSLIGVRERYETLKKQKGNFEATYPDGLSESEIEKALQNITQNRKGVDEKLAEDHNTLNRLHSEITNLEAQLKKAHALSAVGSAVAGSQNTTIQRLENEIAALKQQALLQPHSPQIQNTIQQKQRELDNARTTQNTLKIATIVTHGVESYASNTPEIAKKIGMERRNLQIAEARFQTNKTEKEALMHQQNDYSTKQTALHAYRHVTGELNELHDFVNTYKNSNEGKTKIYKLQNAINTAITNMGGMAEYEQLQTCFRAAFTQKKERQTTKQRNVTQKANRYTNNASGIGLLAFLGFVAASVLVSFNPVAGLIAFGLSLLTAVTGIALYAMGETYREQAAAYTRKKEQLEQDLIPYCTPSIVLEFTPDNVSTMPSAPPPPYEALQPQYQPPTQKKG